MPAFPLDTAQLVALFVECILYGDDLVFLACKFLLIAAQISYLTGIYLVTFCMCVRELWTSKSSSLLKHRMLVVATLLLMVFATSDIAFGLRHVLDAFVYYKGPGGAIGELSDISYWVNVMKGINYCCQTTIGDFVLVGSRSSNGPEYPLN